MSHWVPGRASASGTTRISKIAVTTEKQAVTAFSAPASQYDGNQIVQISIKCVPPQATMNAPKHRNIQLKGMSRRLRVKYTSVTGIVRYEMAIRASETTCSSTSPGVHR